METLYYDDAEGNKVEYTAEMYAQHEIDNTPKTPTDTELKYIGVEFQGVMCSATSKDMWGLNSIQSWVASGNDVPFQFDNGNTLVLTPENYQAFSAVWMPFRASFFQQGE